MLVHSNKNLATLSLGFYLYVLTPERSCCSIICLECFRTPKYSSLELLAPHLLEVVASLARRPGGERLVVGVIVPGQGDDGGRA